MISLRIFVPLLVIVHGPISWGQEKAAAAVEKVEMYAEVKLAEILAAPGTYDGKLVLVTGYRRNTSQTDDLFLSKAEGAANVRSASIQLAGFKDPEKAVFSLAEHEAISNTEVRVLGVFRVDDFFPEQKGYLTQLRWIRAVRR